MSEQENENNNIRVQRKRTFFVRILKYCVVLVTAAPPYTNY